MIKFFSLLMILGSAYMSFDGIKAELRIIEIHSLDKILDLLEKQCNLLDESHERMDIKRHNTKENIKQHIQELKKILRGPRRQQDKIEHFLGTLQQMLTDLTNLSQNSAISTAYLEKAGVEIAELRTSKK